MEERVRKPKGQALPAKTQAAAAEHGAVHGTKAITRAMLILRLIARYEILGVRLSQLTNLTGIPHPTIRRVLRALIDERLVVQDEKSRRYRLGPMNFELGLATLHKPEFSKRLHPLLANIAQASGDTTYLIVRSGADSVCLDRVDGNGAIRAVTMEVGGRRPLGFGAASLALLAQYSDDEIREILEINKREVSYNRRMNIDRILRGVAATRERGYSITRDIVTIGAVSVGIAFQSTVGKPHFAISLSSTRDRMSKDRIEALAKMMATEMREFADLTKWPF